MVSRLKNCKLLALGAMALLSTLLGANTAFGRSYGDAVHQIKNGYKTTDPVLIQGGFHDPASAQVTANAFLRRLYGPEYSNLGNHDHGVMRYDQKTPIPGITKPFWIAYARARWSSPFVGGSGGGGGGAAGKQQAVYVHNKTSHRLWVAVNYQLGGQWQTQGFTILEPGQKSGAICYTDNRWIYFYANGPGRQPVWGGSDTYQTVQGERYGFFKSDTGTGFGDFTQSFSP